MILSNAGKTIEFNINGYETPEEELTSDILGYVDNILKLEIKYTYRKRTHIYYDDESLDAYDLAEITESFEKIIEGKEVSCIFDFFESTLQLAVARFDEKIVFIFQFVYDTTIRTTKRRKIAVLLSREEALAVLDEFKSWVKKYPVRKCTKG